MPTLSLFTYQSITQAVAHILNQQRRAVERPRDGENSRVVPDIPQIPPAVRVRAPLSVQQRAADSAQAEP